MKTKTVYVVQYSYQIKEPYYWEDCDGGEHEDVVAAIHQVGTYWKPCFDKARIRVIRRVTTEPTEEIVYE